MTDKDKVIAREIYIKGFKNKTESLKKDMVISMLMEALEQSSKGCSCIELIAKTEKDCRDYAALIKAEAQSALTEARRMFGEKG